MKRNGHRGLRLLRGLPLIAVALPPTSFAVACGVVAALGALDVHPLWRANSLTISEAAYLGEDGIVARFLINGRDPNRSARLRPGIAGEHELRLPPLTAAIAGRQSRTIGLLLAHGVDLQGETGRVAACLASQAELSDVVAALKASGAADERCADVRRPW